MTQAASVFDWDDLRYVLAVFRAGSAVTAAQRIGVNASTVQRRISRFEKANGIHLFERRRRGLHPTAQCRALVAEAEVIDERVAALQRDILGSDTRLEGILRLTTTETFLASALAQELANFKQIHPAIDLQVTLTNARLNLSRQDADVTIRPSMSPPDTLVGLRVAGLVFAAYGHSNLCHDVPPAPDIGDLQHLPWLGVGRELTASPPAEWMATNIDPASHIITLDSFTALTNCAQEGVGFALLPCSLGDECDGLVRIDLPGEALETSLWLLTHPEIRNAARIRAFMDHFARALRKHRDLFEGRTIDKRANGAISLERFHASRQS